MSDASTLVNKLWSYCNVLRDDGLSYGDYLEQLTYLLFLKMADEYTRPPWKRPSPVPEGYDWPSLLAKDGDELEIHYRHTLEHLGKQRGFLRLVFQKAQNKISDPAKLRRLVADLIDREKWVTVGVDVKGDAYEGLLEKNAQDTKSGAASTSPRGRSSTRSSSASARSPARTSSTPRAAPAASCSRPTRSSPIPRTTPTSPRKTASTCASTACVASRSSRA